MEATSLLNMVWICLFVCCCEYSTMLCVLCVCIYTCTLLSESIHTPWSVQYFVVTAWWIQINVRSHTQYLMMTKWKNENEIQKYLIYISIHTPESIYVKISFGSNYSCESFLLSLSDSFPHLDCTICAHYSFLNYSCSRQPFSSLAIDFQAGLSQNCN